MTKYRQAIVTLQVLIVSFGAFYGMSVPAGAQGICVPETLVVTDFSGKIVSQLENGETPLPQASVALLEDSYQGRVIVETTTDKDGGFRFNQKLKPDKYILKVSYPNLAAFFGRVRLTASKAQSSQQELVVTIGAVFAKPCGGSFAELRTIPGVKPARGSTSDSYLFNVYFMDEWRGWLLGAASGSGFMFQTTDGGKHWQERYRSPDGLSKIRFANEKVGWMIGGNGLILRTSSGAVRWTRQASGTDVLLTGLDVIDTNNAWVSGASGTLLTTKDGGITWKKRRVDTAVGISDITFVDPKHG